MSAIDHAFSRFHRLQGDLCRGINNKPRLTLFVCCLMGAISPLGFAPFQWWLIPIFSIAVFAAIATVHHSSGKQFFFYAFAFALGYFGTGVSWVYYSIYHFGSTSLPLSILLTSIFVSFVAFVFSVPFYALVWIKPALRLAIGFPLIWVFSEWVRTWILTGFPWLFIGYTHIDNGLAGWAPIGGVLLISLFTIASSCMGILLLKHRQAIHIRLILGIFVSAIWLGGYGLKGINWTSPVDDEITVGLVQPNIPQHLRWHADYQTIIQERLTTLSEPLWGNDWIIWPEGAIHDVYHRSLDFIDTTKQLAKQHNTTVISGVLYDPVPAPGERQHYFNSVFAIHNSEGIYHKQRLVPFGEYVPLEHWIRGLIEFFDLPFSVISTGSPQQQNLRIGQYSLANAICYEIAYPVLVATQSAQAHVLLTVSNDAWFGDSIGPLQHFQMARMRALEVGRYVIRGTNNGVSAIIKPNGTVQNQAEQFAITTLQGTVTPMTGATPFMQWKNYLILSILGIMLITAFNYSQWRRTRRPIKSTN